MGTRENFLAVKSEVEKAAASCGRKDGVRLLAVSKFHSLQKILEVADAGQTLFGENRVQEAKVKFPEAKKIFPNAELHIIGHLQKNKVKDALQIASCIQSVDSEGLLSEIERRAALLQKKIRIFFELRTGEETKSGFEKKEEIFFALKKFAEGRFPHVEPCGFMTMAPFSDSEGVVRAAFKKLRSVRDEAQKDFPQFDLHELSMGMSCDYKIAIEEGATIVRIGSAIFGERTLA